MGNTKKILIVEDNSDLQFLFADALKQHGYVVQTVNDGSEALDLLKSTTFDLILLDIIMPITDGIAFLKSYTPQITDPKPKIVLLTNFAYQDVLEEAAKYGVSGYLLKSDITPALLSESVDRYLA